MRLFSLLSLILLSSLFLSAQSNKLDPKSFITTGTASAVGAHCFQLTPNQLWQGGTLWYKHPIRLDEPFEMEMDLKFGCDDNGADGMVFIFHPRIRNGFQGEGIGFGGLKPAFGIEMDTYMNPHLADPDYDHLALIKNGVMHHDAAISEAIPLLAGNQNIENCKAHRVKITWTPEAKNLKIFINGDVRLDTQYDIIGEIFQGRPNVFWGISSATGGQHNQHMICLEKLEFSNPNSFSQRIQKKLFAGEEHTLRKVDFIDGKSTLKPIADKELNKLVKLLKTNPDFHVYINGHTDDVGSASKNKAISKKRADEVAKYLMENGIPKERIKTNGFGETQPKVKNNSPENRLLNRRVDIFLTVPRA